MIPADAMPQRPRPRPPAPSRERPARAPSRWPAFAAVSPGLEPVLVHELSTLGIHAVAEPGGAAFEADADALGRIHRWSRVAGRVTVQVGRTTATSLDGLYNGVRGMPWRAA